MKPAILLYDDQCTTCINCMRFLTGVAGKRVQAMALKNPEAVRLTVNMSYERLMGSFHLVLGHGQVVSGAEAIPWVIRLLPGGKLPAWILRRAPGAHFLLKHVYEWMARGRWQEAE